MIKYKVLFWKENRIALSYVNEDSLSGFIDFIISKGYDLITVIKTDIACVTIPKGGQ